MSDLVLIVEIAGRRVAFGTSIIHSVIDVDQVTPVPRAPGFVLGLTALRSQALTVIDCKHAISGPQAFACEPTGPAVIVTFEGHLYALRVEAVNDVTEALSDPAPVPGESGTGWARIGRGMIETPKGAVLLADISRLLSGPDELAA